LDQDPKKKTIVVLGNGWGATSFLKSLDNEDYNVVVVSPRNYFLFSPLLPSVTVGTLEARSIIQPTRYITRHKKRKCAVYEAEATDVDPVKKTVTFRDASETNETHKEVTIPYDYLVYGVGAENQTFGIKGVKEYGCFLKELKDADKIRRKLLDCEFERLWIVHRWRCLTTEFCCRPRDRFIHRTKRGRNQPTHAHGCRWWWTDRCRVRR
jgi:NADH:ubiquinone reductase (non-electrogenic)